jgi:hypothetical protein
VSASSAPEPLDVHVGQRRPALVEDGGRRPSLADVAAISRTGRARVVPLIATEDIDWDSFGLMPRWVGDDTTGAVAALEPSIFSGRGAQEWDRFVAGTHARGEVALAVAMLGSLNDDEEPVRSVFGPSASVYIPGGMFTSVGGGQISLARPPDVSDGLGRADRDLALRIRNGRRTESPWWSLRLSAAAFESPTGTQVREPQGSLTPLLTSAGGEVVAAVWESPSMDVRLYVLPAMESWKPVLDWLVTKALPEFVPSAARRSRSNIADDPALQTADEAAVVGELARLEREYEERRAGLGNDLVNAQAKASAVRDPLLFGGGAELVGAVARVLTDAGLDVVDLDEFVGRTDSADLLVTDGRGQRLLVEVKSASGMPSERLVGDLSRHLQTWPQIRDDLPVGGGLLVVNHQMRVPPAERSPRLFTRVAFVESLTVATLSSIELFGWWRRGDFTAIREALFGAASIGSSPTAPPASPPDAPSSKRLPFGLRRSQ